MRASWRTLSRRAAHASRRALVAGTHATERLGRPAQGRGGPGCGQRTRSGATAAASLQLATRHDSRHPPPLEWTIRGDGYGGGLRNKPVARSCGYPMAGGPHTRCLGNVLFSSRPDSDQIWSAGHTNRAVSNRTPMTWVKLFLSRISLFCRHFIIMSELYQHIITFFGFAGYRLP